MRRLLHRRRNSGDIRAAGGSCNMPDQWGTPVRIWREIVLANLRHA
jgi:hypothetical protein